MRGGEEPPLIPTLKKQSEAGLQGQPWWLYTETVFFFFFLKDYDKLHTPFPTPKTGVYSKSKDSQSYTASTKLTV